MRPYTDNELKLVCGSCERSLGLICCGDHYNGNVVIADEWFGKAGRVGPGGRLKGAALPHIEQSFVAGNRRDAGPTFAYKCRCGRSYRISTERLARMFLRAARVGARTIVVTR